MDSTGADSFRRGAFAGLCVAGAALVEMVAWNRRILNPQSVLALGALWAVAGVVLGALGGWLGGRAARIVHRRSDDGDVFFGFLVTGHLLLPLGYAPLAALAIPVARILRRRLLPRHTRVDVLVPVAAALAATLVLTESEPPLPPAFPPDAPLAPDAPMPGSSPVAITIHAEPGFPDVPAVHVELSRLRSADVGRLASLWTGRLPDRTRVGRGVPRALPGGGGVSRVSDRPLPRAMIRLFPRAVVGTPPFVLVGTLERLAESAGIPVLRTPPADTDPPLHLRLLETERPPDAELARALAQAGLWIDVTLGAQARDEIAMAGGGVPIRPLLEEAALPDVLPTTLHVLGLAIPRGCDGRALTERLDPNGAGARPTRYRSLGVSTAPETSASTTPR